MYTIVFYGVAVVALLVSLAADRRRTARALTRAWKALVGIAPEFITVIVATGVILSFLSPDTIASVIGSQSGPGGVLLSSVVGSVTLMPGFVAFPMAAILMEKGAGILQIAAFVSALMMVGVITLPMESRAIGRRAAVTRNVLAWLFSLSVAALLALVLGVLGVAETL